MTRSSISRRDFLRNSALYPGLVAAAVGTDSEAAAESPPDEIERAHFHHVHLNVTDPAKTLQFYRFMFGAIPMKFRGVSDTLFTERSFILLNKVDRPIVRHRAS